MTIGPEYLSQLLLLGLLGVIGWLIRARLTDVASRFDELQENVEKLHEGQARARERLIRIEGQMNGGRTQVNIGAPHDP